MRYAFAGCEIDTDAYVLRRDGAAVPVEPQVFDLIALLAREAGRLVTKDRLVEEVWQGRIVSDATISARINAARTAVGDDGKTQKVIRTVTRRGLELIAPVTVIEGADRPAPAAPARQTIRYATSADGTSIAFSTAGDGPPLLRLGQHLTHLEADWASPLWQPTWARHCASRTLIRYDLRGTGLSEANLESNTVEDHVADLEAVVAGAGFETFEMLAELQGSIICARYIADNPGRVTRLVIQNGYTIGRHLRPDAPEDPEADPFVALLKNDWGNPASGFMRGWASVVMPELSHDDLTAFIGVIGSACPPANILENRKTIDLLDGRGWFERIDVPTLVLHSSKAAVHPISEGRKVAAAIPGAEFMEFDTGNTVIVAVDPTWDAQMSAIEDFLERGEGRDG